MKNFILLILSITISSCTVNSSKKSDHSILYDSITKAQDSVKTEWKKIYYILATEEDIILYKAQQIFKPSEFEKYGDFTNKEIGELRVRIKNKYNLSDSIFNKIVYEGAYNKWPFQSSF